MYCTPGQRKLYTAQVVLNAPDETTSSSPVCGIRIKRLTGKFPPSGKKGDYNLGPKDQGHKDPVLCCNAAVTVEIQLYKQSVVLLSVASQLAVAQRGG